MDGMTMDVKKYLIKKVNISDNKTKTSKLSKKSKFSDIFLKKTGHVNPVIVSFQNGQLNEKTASDLKVVLSPKENGTTGVVVKTPSGHVFKDSNFNVSHKRKEMVAIRNRKTKKIRLVEVERVVLINKALLGNKESSATTTNYAKDIKTLQKTFGGKKIVNRLEKREKVNVNSMLISNEVKNAIADLKVEDTSSLNVSESDSITGLLPPCHRDAVTISEVYPLKEILSTAELESLKAEMSGKKDFKPKDYTEFFLYCYEEAKKSEENLDNRLAGILFIEVLLKFLKIPPKRLGVKKLVLCPFSNVIHAKLLNEFCVKNESSVTRPLTMKDKSLCYIIALCLICCNYQINLKLLAAATAVHLSRLVRLARVVGAVQISKTEHTFVLKLPLPALPKSSVGKIKRK